MSLTISAIMHIIMLNKEVARCRIFVQLSGEPIFLTKNGVGSIVVMSMESYEQNRYDSMVYDKLREAELQAASTAERLSHADVMAKARAFLSGAEEQKRA